MAEFDTNEAMVNSSAAQLSRILSFDEGLVSLWNERDLPGMLMHQFHAPVAFDLRSWKLAGHESRTRDKSLSGAAKERIRTFEDLLFHRHPPAALLRLSKEFFKRRLRQCERDSSNWRVAYLFYLMSILAAGECRSEISSLSPGDLQEGIDWAVKQNWVDERTRAFFAEARAKLGSDPDL